MPGGYQLRPPDEQVAVADSWPLVMAEDVTVPGHDRGGGIEQAHLRCNADGCGQSVICLNPDVLAGPRGYALTAGEIAAATLAHIRQCHDPVVPLT